MPMQQGVPTPSFEYQGDYNQMPAPNPPKSKLPFILGGVCALFAAAGIALGASTLILGHAPWSSGEEVEEEKDKDKDDKKTKKDEKEDKEEEKGAEDSGKAASSEEVTAAKEQLDAAVQKAASYLSNPQYSVLSRYQQEAQKYLDDGDAVQAQKSIKKLENLAGAAGGQSPIKIEVEQADASTYPNVKLYARIYESAGGNSVNDLEQDGFFITEQVGTGTYAEVPVSRAVQLNQAERLNICMTADLSGSMMGSPLQEAKTVMRTARSRNTSQLSGLRKTLFML